ncbi:MAG: DUF3300 domain-containing protein [Verrucomicrobia bacterium]|nr:DUF3300 domain-containing protein [Verrucomicrobiota bacterium]
MNARFILLFSVCSAALAQPATPPPPPPATADAPGAPTAATTADPARTPEQLDQLLGPIALYPDALMAVILPASTVPSDIVLASRFLAAGGTAEAIDSQPWDDSVRSLAHYPEVVKWMDDNLEWTKELGDAFVAQPADVMKAVQRLRTKAQANGALKNTPQQQVVMEGQDISIIPAQPEVIYVPVYDPAVVYVATAYYPDPFLTFGVGFAMGPWLYYGCDWGQRVIWVGPRGPHGGWRPPTVYSRPHYANNPDWRHWHPLPRARFGNRPSYYHPRPDIVRPRPYTGASPRPNWPRGTVGHPTGPGPQARDNHPGGQPRAQWPRLTNQGAGSRLEPAPGAVAPQEANGPRPPGGRPTPTPAPNVNGATGPRNGGNFHRPPDGGWNRGDLRGNPPAAPAASGNAAPQATPPAPSPRPVAGPPPVRQSAPFREQRGGPPNGGPAHVNTPHPPPAPHVTPVTPPAPTPRPTDRDKNQN